MTFAQEYYQIVTENLETIFNEESAKIQKVGKVLAEVIKNDGLIYAFGCGHSHMIEEELFYRAGGLAPISPIFESSIMLHEGAVKSTQIERMSGYAQLVFDRYPVTENDAFLIASTSGINPFPIEMAQAAKKVGAPVICISSHNYLSQPSRQKEGLHLADVCDIAINNHVPVGDAAVEVRDDGTKSGPISSLALFFIVNSLMLSACDHLKQWGIEPPVFMSGNCEGGDQFNADHIKKFKNRIKHL